MEKDARWREATHTKLLWDDIDDDLEEEEATVSWKEASWLLLMRLVFSELDGIFYIKTGTEDFFRLTALFIFFTLELALARVLLVASQLTSRRHKSDWSARMRLTFKVLSACSKLFPWAVYRMDTWEEPKRFGKRSIWRTEFSKTISTHITCGKLQEVVITFFCSFSSRRTVLRRPRKTRLHYRYQKPIFVHLLHYY